MSDSPVFRRRSNRGSANIRAGYVPVDEDYLQQSGIRGCKSWCLCATIVFLLLVALINALVTVGLVYFMSISHVGMESLEFFPGGQYLRVLDDVHVDEVMVHGDMVGKVNNTVDISGEKIMLGQSEGANIEMDANKTVLTSSDFKLVTSEGKPIFATNTPLNFALYQVTNLHASEIDVGEITAQEGVEGLHIESFNNANVIGMEGVTIETDTDIDISASKNIFATSLGSIKLMSEEGIYMSPNMPLEGKATTKAVGQFKLCVCVPSGKVFAVPFLGQGSGCHAANEDKHPCVD